MTNSTKTNRFLLAASISLAMAITMSCSSGSSEEENNPSSNSITPSSSSTTQSSSSAIPPSSGTTSSSSSVAPSSSSALSSSSAISSSSSGAGGNSGTFTDTRDSKTYKWVKIGSQIWMAENLNYNADGSKCGGGGSSSTCVGYGRIYNWNTAMNNSASSTAVPSGVRGICPEGWHLPSDDEWTALTDYVESDRNCASCAGMHLKAVSGWGMIGSSHTNLDTYDFAALPGGYNDGSSFQETGDVGHWWSATEYVSNLARSRRMHYQSNSVDGYFFFKTSLISIRCVKNGG